jgi:hypothetical protein
METQSKEQLASNPETAPETLWELATNYPDEVASNPALPLIILSSPEIGIRIQQRVELAFVKRRLIVCYRLASRTLTRRWRHDCAVRVLHLYEESEPLDTYPRRLLERMSWFLDGNLSGRALSQYAAKEIDYWMRADGSSLGLSMAKSEEEEKLAYHRAAASFAARAVFQAAKNSIDGNQPINEEYPDDAAMCAALARGYQTAAQ